MRQPSPHDARVAPGWRVLLAIVGGLDIGTGGWALINPRSWYEDFPGFGHHWVVGQGGAYNEHLASDAGAGFLAVGIVLVVCAAIGAPLAVRLAGLALLVHALPHFIFHLDNAPEHLGSGDKLAGTYGLLAQAVIGAVVLIAAQPRRRRTY